MNLENLNTSRELYSIYSPLKTNAQLFREFQGITGYDLNVKIEDIRDVYNKYIVKNFLNENVIKSAFIERYSLSKSPGHTVTIFEMNVGSSRADICIINGKSMVFEIKTEYDSFARLSKQLEDYEHVFEYVCLVVPECKIYSAINQIGENTGIIFYKQNRLGNIKFYEHRSPKYNNDIDPIKQLETLTKTELKKLLKLSQNNKSELINDIVSSYNQEEINFIFKENFKDKYRDRWLYIHKHQNELYSLDYQWFFKNNLSISAVYK
jgi:hypothetical protein